MNNFADLTASTGESFPWVLIVFIVVLALAAGALAYLTLTRKK